MYMDIVDSELRYPSYLNPQVIDLLKGLLDKNSATRLSYKDLNYIKSHPWCKSIDWDLVSKK